MAEETKDKKADVLESLADAINDVVQETLATIEAPTIRDEERVAIAAKMKAIRERVSEINWEIADIMPAEMKKLESEKRKLTERWKELAQDLETHICSDSKQLNLDEGENEDA